MNETINPSSVFANVLTAAQYPSNAPFAREMLNARHLYKDWKLIMIFEHRSCCMTICFSIVCLSNLAFALGTGSSVVQ